MTARGSLVGTINALFRSLSLVHEVPVLSLMSSRGLSRVSYVLAFSAIIASHGRAQPATIPTKFADTTYWRMVTEFSESGSPAVDLIKNFEWTNEDQNLVSKYIAEDGMDPDEAAQKWIDDNPDKVDAWLP